MKGIILAGGNGSRLQPITKVVSKQLMPIYDKPMIYYPLSTLMLSGIRDILIITTPESLSVFQSLLKDGKHIGLNISYEQQPSPDGLAQAFIIAEKFIQNDDVCLILGDNIFYGQGLGNLLLKAKNNTEQQNRASIFGYYVNNPQEYGVVEFNEQGEVTSIIEKPKDPKSNYAVVGLYYYPNDVIKKAKKIKPSQRGELEITSINEEYLKEGKLSVEMMGRGYAWLDAGTHENLLEAGQFIATIEKRTSLKVACIEEIAYRNGWIGKEELKNLSKPLLQTGYGQYLLKISKEL